MQEKTAEKQNKGGLVREIARYLLFGVLTTAVAMVSNFGILWGGKAVFGVTENAGTTYFAIYTVAKAVSWVCAVLFAFFTNKKWVFNDNISDRRGVSRQLAVFAGGRVATLGLDYLLNWAMLWLMGALALNFLDGLFGVSLNTYNELIAWFVTQVAVVVSNYFVSKLFVFRENKTQKAEKSQEGYKKTEK